MSLRRVRTRHVYVSAAAAFVLLVGFEGVRMAAGHDPALGAPAAAATVVPTPAAPDDGGWGDPGAAPDNGGGWDDQGQVPNEVPQPESRLS